MLFSNRSTIALLTSFAYLVMMIISINLSASQSGRTQPFNSSDREQFRTMLKDIKNDLQKNYYDPGFRGIDLEGRFNGADEEMKQAISPTSAVRIIGQFLLDLDDPSTFFVPPWLHLINNFGFDMQIIGDQCYIVAVKPGSDAATKGLKVGDQIHSVILRPGQSSTPARENLWKIRLMWTLLMPQPSVRVEVQSPGGQKREVEVIGESVAGKSAFNIEEAQRLLKKNIPPFYQYVELSPDVSVWQIKYLAELRKSDIDKVIDKVRKRQALILDLRRATGVVFTNKFGGILGKGKLSTDEISKLEFLAGHFFDQDVKIADMKSRGKSEPMEAKTRPKRVFTGKLVMIVDSDTETIAEIFARMLQLEKRCSVIGDRTSGTARIPSGFRRNINVEASGNIVSISPYGASITTTDVIMSDGQSLDRKGVTPDEILFPTPTDLAARRDPVLSRAADKVGVKLTPEQAGALFPAKTVFTVWLK
jgi:C-terminal processing protease CtpA/Prc